MCTQIPLGAGLGFAHKYRNDGHVAFALYGDGAANQGQAAEVLSHVCSLPGLMILLLFFFTIPACPVTLPMLQCQQDPL